VSDLRKHGQGWRERFRACSSSRSGRVTRERIDGSRCAPTTATGRQWKSRHEGSCQRAHDGWRRREGSSSFRDGQPRRGSLQRTDRRWRAPDGDAPRRSQKCCHQEPGQRADDRWRARESHHLRRDGQSRLGSGEWIEDGRRADQAYSTPRLTLPRPDVPGRLTELNHGPDFWQEVERLPPEYQELNSGLDPSWTVGPGDPASVPTPIDPARPVSHRPAALPEPPAAVTAPGADGSAQACARERTKRRHIRWPPRPR